MSASHLPTDATDAALPPVRATAGGDARQREQYGDSWSHRLHRLLQGYRLSQARLASVIGLSAPMLSQLISGQRQKIGNPAVYARVVRLEELLDEPRIAAGEPTELARVLAEVAASHPVLTTRTATTAPQAALADGGPAASLASLATAAQLAAVAVAADQVGAGPLAAALREAADLGAAPQF